MKFVVVSHDTYRKTNGGLTVLLTLAKRLFERGHDTKIYLTRKEGYEHNTYFARYHTSNTVDDDTIVIYIDIPEGNILNAKRVVRYITYGSHWYPNYTPNEMTYYHAPFCKNNPAKKRLCILYLDPCVKDLGLPRIYPAIHAIKKGIRIPGVRATLGHANAWTTSHGPHIDHDIPLEQMVHVLNQTEAFYCYDPCSFMIIMALLCGAIVVQHPVDGYTEAEWRYTIGIGDLPGIAYGLENIPRAKATLAEAPEACRKLIAETEMHIDNFLRDMEMGVKGEPCYKFNDSPYAIQHVMK
jgi:hypothetical protein